MQSLNLPLWLHQNVRTSLKLQATKLTPQKKWRGGGDHHLPWTDHKHLVLQLYSFFLLLFLLRDLCFGYDLKLHPLCWCCRTSSDWRKEVRRKKWEEEDLWRHQKTTTHLSFVCASITVVVLVIGEEGGRKKPSVHGIFWADFVRELDPLVLSGVALVPSQVQARFTFGLDRKQNTATKAFQRWICQFSCWADRLTLILGQSVFLFLLILSFV